MHAKHYNGAHPLCPCEIGVVPAHEAGFDWLDVGAVWLV